MATDHNPGYRLHKLLKSGPHNGTDKIQAIVAFGQILDVPENDTQMLLVRVSEMLALPAEIKKRVEIIENVDRQLYLGWYEKAEHGICNLNLRGHWKTFMDSFPPESVTSIEFCGHLIAQHFPEKLIEQKNLDELLAQVDDLLHSLEDVELPSSDWYFIYHHLVKVRETIVRYSTTGLPGIEDAYSEAVGAICLAPGARKKLATTTSWRKLLKVLNAVGLALSIYGGTSQLTHDIGSLLGDDS